MEHAIITQLHKNDKINIKNMKEPMILKYARTTNDLNDKYQEKLSFTMQSIKFSNKAMVFMLSY